MPNKPKTSVKDYQAKVDAIMKKKYGITWADACGEEEPLRRAITNKVPAQQFVDDYGEKYDLIPLL